MSFLSAISRVKSIYDIGIKVRNHIYTRRNFKLLMKKHAVMLKQLEAANRILANSDIPAARGYCEDYAIPSNDNN